MFPKCRITCAEHPDGRLMSTPAGFDLKLLRMGAHDLLEKKFGSWRDKAAKQKMYAWLKENSKTGHIGLMDEVEVQEVIDKLKGELGLIPERKSQRPVVGQCEPSLPPKGDENG
jgi:hypothetical protein